MKQLCRIFIACLLVVNFFYLTSCDDDDDDKSSQRTYALDPLSGSGVSGTVTFKKQNDQTTLITIQLSGTEAGDSHPAHIHSGSVGSGGPIILDFNPVDGATGKSETTVTMMNDGSSVTYEQLIALDGHVNVHLSATQLDVMIAQGNIGANSEGVDTGDGDGGY
jgi:hypothetical protein